MAGIYAVAGCRLGHSSHATHVAAGMPSIAATSRGTGKTNVKSAT